MKIQQLLEHHGVTRNPFVEEDAQTDPVFKDHCIDSTYHPVWDKVYGDPREPATSIVFGEKGAGKTALRLQIARHLAAHNRQRESDRLFVVHYDDFNPFLDRFRARFGARSKVERVLAHWKLWDHMDAILSLGVTAVVDRLLDPAVGSGDGSAVAEERITALRHFESRDLLLLAAAYDQSTAETPRRRFTRLARRLRYFSLKVWWDLLLGWVWMLAALAGIGAIWFQGGGEWLKPLWLWLLLSLVGWLPYLIRQARCWLLARRLVRHVRVGNLETSPLRQILMRIPVSEIATQPLPLQDRTDDRYESLVKLQGILKTLGFSGMLVLVDRVDEPHLINGSAGLMRSLVWPLLDNKFLKHNGLGLKLMLPEELLAYIEKEDRDFYQRARLDKQNMVRSLQWSGEALFDVMNARIKACAANGSQPSVRALFDDSVSDQRLLEAFRALRVPRHLTKFLHRVLVDHCNKHTDDRPQWKIASETFESALALALRDQDAFDRGTGAG